MNSKHQPWKFAALVAAFASGSGIAGAAMPDFLSSHGFDGGGRESGAAIEHAPAIEPGFHGHPVLMAPITTGSRAPSTRMAPIPADSRSPHQQESEHQRMAPITADSRGRLADSLEDDRNLR